MRRQDYSISAANNGLSMRTIDHSHWNKAVYFPELLEEDIHSIRSLKASENAKQKATKNEMSRMINQYWTWSASAKNW
jgi:hypothetical protein